MQTEVAEKLYSVKEYLAFEERAKNKHEYDNGKIIKMPGASFKHCQIATNIIAILVNASYSTKFSVNNSDIKIHFPQFNSFVYPDAVVVFEKPEFYEGRKDVIINPLLIVEVYSPSTKKHDRTLKFQEHKTLPSFKEYVLVTQDKPWCLLLIRLLTTRGKTQKPIHLMALCICNLLTVRLTCRECITVCSSIRRYNNFLPHTIRFPIHTNSR